MLTDFAKALAACWGAIVLVVVLALMILGCGSDFGEGCGEHTSSSSSSSSSDTSSSSTSSEESSSSARDTSGETSRGSSTSSDTSSSSTSSDESSSSSSSDDAGESSSTGEVVCDWVAYQGEDQLPHMCCCGGGGPLDLQCDVGTPGCEEGGSQL